MKLSCPHCGTDIDVTGQLIGDRILHTRCNGWVLIARRGDGSVYGVKVQAPKVVKR